VAVLTVLYILLFLHIRKNPQNVHPTWAAEENVSSQSEAMSIARSLLWYPSVYVILTMPLSIVRFADIVGHPWSQTAVFTCASLYVCEGWCNVLLYTATRPGLISWTWLGWTKAIPRYVGLYHPSGQEIATPLVESAIAEDSYSRGGSPVGMGNCRTVTCTRER
jgi:hypothetical protein